MSDLIKGTTAIETAIKSIAARGKKLDADIQHCGLSILAHVEEHGDTTLADRLITAMPKGSRKLALVEWMLAFGKMVILDKANPADAKRIQAGHFVRYAKDKRTDMDAASDKPWYDFKPEPAVLDAFDAQAAVQAVMRRLAKATASGLDIKNKAMALEEAKALVEALSVAESLPDEAEGEANDTDD